MARNESYTIRLGVQGGKVVTAELGRVGQQGQQSFERIEKAGKGATRTMGDMSRLILTRLVPAFAAMRAARSIFDNVQQFELIDQRLKRLAKTTEDYTRIQNYLRESSDRLNIDIATLADSYARLLALEESGILNRDEVDGLAEGFANLKAALGVDDSQIGNVLYGISQAFSQGVVQAQELNQVIEPVPGFLNRIAEAAGEKNPQAFREMVKAGEVTSEAFKNYVLQALKDYDGAAEDISDTSVAAVTRLRNSWVNLSRTLGESFLVTGTSEIAESATSIIEWINEISRSAGDAAIQLRDFAYYTNLALIKKTGAFPDYSKANFPNGTIAISTEGRGPDAGALGGDFNSRLQAEMEAVRQEVNRMEEAARNVPKPKLKPEEIIGRGIDLNNKRAEEAARNAQQEIDKINGVVDALRFRNEQLRRGEKEQEVYNQLRQAGVEIDSEAGQQIQQLVEQHYVLQEVMSLNGEVSEGATEALRKYGEQARDTEQQLVDISVGGLQSLEDQMVNVIKGTESLSDAWSSMVDSILEDIIRMQIRQNVTAPLSDSLNGLIGNIFSPSLSQGALDLAGGGSLFNLQGFAKGGISNKPAIFGEGPMVEAAVPLPDGRTIPVTLSGNMGGNSVYNEINIIDQNNNNIQTSTRQGGDGRNIMDVVLTAVAQDINSSSGKVRRAIKNMNSTGMAKG